MIRELDGFFIDLGSHLEIKMIPKSSFFKQSDRKGGIVISDNPPMEKLYF